jgi:hypothetical protein
MIDSLGRKQMGKRLRINSDRFSSRMRLSLSGMFPHFSFYFSGDMLPDLLFGMVSHSFFSVGQAQEQVVLHSQGVCSDLSQWGN